MNKVSDILEREPLAFIAAVATVIEAAVALLPLFGVPLSVDQMAGIMALVAAVGGVVTVVYARPKVTPVAAPAIAAGVRAKLVVDADSLVTFLRVQSLEDVRAMARAVGINPDNIDANTINLYAAELVAYADRTGKLDALADVAAGF